MLFNKPIIEVEQCETLGTAGDIWLANFRQGYLLAEKNGGMRSDYSVHVNYLYDEGVFKFVVRLDGGPMLSNPITPFKGSDTQSHFVRVADR